MNMKKMVSSKVKSLLLALLVLFSCSKDEEIIPIEEYGISKSTIQDSFEGVEYVVYSNGEIGMMQAYNRRAEDNTFLDFELLPGRFPVIMKDNEGNEWNVFGTAVSGSRTGQQLKKINTMMGYWFSFAAMFPQVTLYGEPNRECIDVQLTSTSWLINPQELFIGTFKDGIRSLDSPKFIQYQSNIKNEVYINDNELVIANFDGEFVRVYPHKVMDWHEVLNDYSNIGESVLSYCPLTGTASIWGRRLENLTLTFGVSGLLYNSNLILYDRETGSFWSQMRQQCVNGRYLTSEPEIFPYIEMTWRGAKKLDHELLVLSNDQGFSYNYNDYPYGDYRTNHHKINFPVNYSDNRVPNKERVLGVIINNKVKVYRFEH